MTDTGLYSKTSDPRIREEGIRGLTGDFSLTPVREDTGLNEINELTQRVETLTNITTQFRAEVLASPIKWTTQIRELGEEGYKLAAPVSVLLEEYPYDDTIIARLPELEIFGEGVTDAEAITNLKLAILDLYDELTEAQPDTLSDLPQGWLRVLREMVARD